MHPLDGFFLFCHDHFLKLSEMSRITSDKILIFKNCTYINQRETSCRLNHLSTDKADCRRNERTDRGESETMGNGVKWLRWKN